MTSSYQYLLSWQLFYNNIFSKKISQIMEIDKYTGYFGYSI